MEGLIDTHFHLDMYKNHAEIFEYLNEKHIYTLAMTNSPGVYLACKQLYNKGKYVKFAMGFHPLNQELKKSDLVEFMDLLPITNYIGEIGMDFSGNGGLPKDIQIICFDKIVKQCTYMNKLMSVHIRKAEDVAIDIIKKYEPSKCIIHWFTGNTDQLERLIQCGCYFSINGNMVKSTDLINRIPRNKILVESDGPYSKVKGKRYRPDLLVLEYEIIARTLNEPELISIVYNNFRNLLIGK